MYTWTRPSLNQKSVIDLFITRQMNFFTVRDVKVRRGADCGSENLFLVSKLLIPFHSITQVQVKDKQNEKLVEVQYNIHLLKEESIRNLYERRLNIQLDLKQEVENIEEEHAAITTAIHQAAKEALGIEQNNKKRENYGSMEKSKNN